jgi:V8-like Glu-specific endopeptidase
MDDEAILEAIRDHPTEAAAALASAQIGDEKPLDVASIDALARRENRDRAEYWLEQLQERRLVKKFVGALRGQGVPLADDVLDDPDSVIPTEDLRRFLARAQSFRCRIWKDEAFAGSGVLVGPSLVLTSWHVISKGKPGQPQEPAPKLEVVLADDQRFDARVPAVFQSECGDAEYVGHAPLHDADIANRHDVALLELVQPVASHLGHISLTAPALPRGRSRVVLVHFPGGVDQVIDFGVSGKIRNVTARRRHNVKTAGGSSGGACFNENLEFIGVHQARFDTTSRFVPAERFVDSIREIVERDVAPPTLWSLDGTPEGPLVIGRSPFFRAIAAAGDPQGRVRGVRIKRTNLDATSTGLGYSHDILQQLLLRRGPDHRLVRIELDEVIDDLVAGIRSKARLIGLDLPDPTADEAGIAPGQAPPETTIKNRAENLAAAIEAAAAGLGATVWMFFDNPSVLLKDASLLAIESFVGAALAKPHLRLVIAGMETVSLPGAEFLGPPAAEGDRSPGLIVDIVGEFRRADVLDLLALASRELTGDVDDAKLDWSVDTALVGLANTNGLYDPDLLPEVASRLRPALQVLAGGV